VLILLYYRLGLPRVLAVLGGVIFAVHPLHTEVVSWLAARNNLKAQLFLPAAVLAYLWACDSATPNQWRVRHAAAIIFMLLAILGKPVAVIVPVMLIAYEFCMERGGGRTLGGLPARTLGLTATFSYIGRRFLPDLSQLTGGGSTAQRLAHRTGRKRKWARSRRGRLSWRR
jgi:hypothetical protein